MDAVLKAVLIQIGCYLALVLGILFIINRWSVGFLGKWLGVKRSRGQKVMVNARTHIQDYFALGWIDQGWLIFKGRDKKLRRLAITGNPFYRRAGVVMVDVDDEKNAVVNKDFSVVPGHDAEKTEDLYIRALYKPTMLDNQTKVILVVLIITLLAVLAVGYMSYNWHQGTLEAINALKQPVAATAGQGINVATGGA